MQQEWIYALIGGALIGIAVSIMLLFNGRVTGVSGIVNGILQLNKNEWPWRVCFVLGLLVGGLFMAWFDPGVFASVYEAEWFMTVLAGVLVGFGTVMGGGCTSGHGVCGISRLSLRSIIATILFIAAGIVTVKVVL